MPKKLLFLLTWLAASPLAHAQSNDDTGRHLQRVSDLSRQWRACLNDAAANYAANSCRSHTDLTRAAFGRCFAAERALVDAITEAGATDPGAIIGSSRSQFEEIIGSQILDQQIERSCDQ